MIRTIVTTAALVALIAAPALAGGNHSKNDPAKVQAAIDKDNARIAHFEQIKSDTAACVNCSQKFKDDTNARNDHLIAKAEADIQRLESLLP